VRDDEIRRILTDGNPWWKAAAASQDPTMWISSHRLLRDRFVYDLGFRSEVLDDVSREPITDRLVVLTGPRRVGKSVVLLDAAASLCRRKDLDPRCVIHLPCDGFKVRDLRRALTLGRELTRVVDRQTATRRVWLLDEVSAIQGWTSVLKAARDGTDFGDDTVVITGSRWSPTDDIEGNLFAGRAGVSSARRIRHLLPMNFRHFLAATRPDLALPAAAHPAELQQATVADTLDELRFAVDAYDLAWQEYLTCGGFPRAVAEQQNQGAVSATYALDLAAWLRHDVDPEFSPESIPLLLEALATRATSPLNIRRTAEALGYTNDRFTVRLHRLTNSFGALWCPQRNDHGRTIPGALSKFYLIDPLLAWIPSILRAGCTQPTMTSLTESTLAVSLARAIERLDEGRWVSSDTIGYSRTGSNNEIDLAPVAVPSSAGPTLTLPIEVKWVDDGWRSGARVIEAKYGRGVLATKSVLDTDHSTWAVPAPLLALLLL